MMQLIGWEAAANIADIVPIKPFVLTHETWPPDYRGIHEWRRLALAKIIDDKTGGDLIAAKAYYSTRPVEFIMDWLDTYDPRRSPNHEKVELRGEKWMPFIFFTKQEDMVLFLDELRRDQQCGLIEKSRDMGATWIACAYSVWSFLFISSDSLGWGSRKEMLVDSLGDPDSIFEKMRLMLRRMPAIWLPKGWSENRHTKKLSLINPEIGSNITGEAGDSIGRGGRKSMYYKDEAAHYEHPEKTESALGDNTNVQVDISSVNGLGNVFHRRREHGINWHRGAKIESGFVRVFVMDWKDHPNKTQQWYDERKAKYEREGMAHVFAQEVDRNYSAAISNTVIPLDWIEAAVDAHLKIPYVREYYEINQPNDWGAGLDVADGGIDRNALSKRQWIIWRTTEEWGERDPGTTARRAMIQCRADGNTPFIPNVQYDCIGIGSNVKSEYNRLVKYENIQGVSQFTPWNAGAATLNPFERIIKDDDQSPCNKDFYENLKAQAWWAMRARFYKTFQVVKNNAFYPVDELISLDSSMVLLEQLKKELAQATRGHSSRLKQLIDKQPKGTKSPNLADSGMMMFFPVPDDYSQILVGSYA